MIYYVSASGNDGNNGTSTGTPWRTIAKVNSPGFTYAAGDSVLFNRGDTWRETITVTRAGTAGAYMVFGAYGTGNSPRILASKTTTWISQGAGVWKSNLTFTDPDDLADYSPRLTRVEHSHASGETDYYGSEIYFELTSGVKQWGSFRTDTAAFTGNYQWTWVLSSGVDGYIYIYCDTDPNSEYTAVEIPQRRHVIDLNRKNYITVSGLTLLYSARDCICQDPNQTPGTYTGLIVEDCEIGYVSTKGSGAGYGIEAWYSSSIFRRNDIHNCGRRAISFHVANNNGFTVSNVLIEDNYFHDGWHTTGPDFNVGRATAAINGVIIRRNKFYDDSTYTVQSPYGWDWSEHMFFQNYDMSDDGSNPTKLQNIFIYSNIFMYPKGNGINVESGKNVNIWNNTFYQHNNDNTARAHVWIDTAIVSVSIRNNAFYSTKSNDIGGGEVFLRDGANLSAVVCNNNLYYRINTSTRIVEDEASGIKYHMNDIALIRSDLGYETNSPTPANPNFTNAPIDFRPLAGSAAIANGAVLSDASFDGLDFNGDAYNSPPVIGAVEIASSTPGTVNSNISWYPESLNIKHFQSTGDYVTFKFYTSTGDRTSESNAVHTFTAPIVYSTITPLSGHTRNTTLRANSPQTVMVTNIPTTVSPLYMDTYISNVSGTRLINLGTKVNGYTTITFA